MFATLYVPNFYLQAAVRHQPELLGAPVALIDGEEAKALILQVNGTAEAAGVRCGMTPSQGLARHLPLVVKTRAREQEKLLTDLLLHFAYSLSPFIEATAPGICTIEFTTAQQLTARVTAVIEQLRESEITARAGLAHTADASLLVAHLARPVLQIGDAKTFLASLPIETLAQV
jgi:protein ImuB